MCRLIENAMVHVLARDSQLLELDIAAGMDVMAPVEQAAAHLAHERA